MIENAGEDRQIAVQIFIDYIQVPMIIEGETYQTFFVDADKSFSKEFCFQIAETLDESVDHKIMAAMTVYSDKHVKDSELEYTTNGYSIALDAVLDIAGNTDQFIMNKLYNYENPRESYKDMWYGVLINTELPDFKRRVPNKEIIAQKMKERTLCIMLADMMIVQKHWLFYAWVWNKLMLINKNICFSSWKKERYKMD